MKLQEINKLIDAMIDLKLTHLALFKTLMAEHKVIRNQ